MIRPGQLYVCDWDAETIHSDSWPIAVVPGSPLLVTGHQSGSYIPCRTMCGSEELTGIEVHWFRHCFLRLISDCPDD